MAKEDIKKLLESAKERLEKEEEFFIKTIQDDLKSFKKKTLDKI
ncbi:MAG TPA: hypothetical protein VD699_01050 [Nitrosopumilaceae archaeon]|nr:hypothetical protein [Nitrosopumilaceae archaeon]